MPILSSYRLLNFELIVFTLQPLQCEELALLLLTAALGCRMFDQMRFLVGGLDLKIKPSLKIATVS